MGKSWDIRNAPLSRDGLDRIAPLVRIFGGIVFIAWSWVSTILMLGALLAPVVHGAVSGIAYSYAVAFVFTVFVTVVEWVTDEWPSIYWSVLVLLDASFTFWQTKAWLYVIVSAQVDAISLPSHLAIWLVSLVCGVIAARFGEKLLLPPRKRTRYATVAR